MFVQPYKLRKLVILPPKSDKSPVMFVQPLKPRALVILPPKSDKHILSAASSDTVKDVILSKSMQISPLSDFTSNVQLLPCACCSPYCHTTFVPVAVAVNVPFPCRNWMVFRLSCAILAFSGAIALLSVSSVTLPLSRSTILSKNSCTRVRGFGIGTSSPAAFAKNCSSRVNGFLLIFCCHLRNIIFHCLIDFRQVLLCEYSFFMPSCSVKDNLIVCHFSDCVQKAFFTKYLKLNIIHCLLLIKLRL